MVVASEELLNTGTFQLLLVLNHGLRVGILPLAVRVLGIEVVLGFGRNERCLYLFVVQGVPVVTSEPLVVFDVFWPVQAQSARRLSLDELVDKVGGLDRPALGDLIFLDLDLFRKNMVSDLLPVSALVGTLAKHAFVRDDTHSEVVNSDAVVLAAHDFRSHVTRCTRSIL